MPLEQELKTYNALKNKLLAESKGKFVLIKGQELLGIYDSRDAALFEGYKRFGNQEFLVKEILEIEAVNFFTSSHKEYECPLYDIDLLFPNHKIAVANITAIESDFEGQRIDGLIGRDVLKNGLMIYSGYDNSFTLAF